MELLPQTFGVTGRETLVLLNFRKIAKWFGIFHTDFTVQERIGAREKTEREWKLEKRYLLCQSSNIIENK